jgi:hypothetical protein
MGTALGLILFVVGAVLTFAIREDPAGIDLNAAGVIIMIASLAQFAWVVYRERWRHRVVEESIERGEGVPPVPLTDDDTVLVDPAAPIVAPAHVDVVDVRLRDDRQS